MINRVIIFLLLLIVLASCSHKDSGLTNVMSESKVKIDNLEDSTYYFLFYSFDVDNRSYKDHSFQVKLLPQNDRLKELIGDSYFVPDFKTNKQPQIFTLLAGEETEFGFTVAVEKELISFKELKEISKDYHYQFVSHQHTATYKK